MRDNSIILITNNFPYGTTETFLEKEIVHLAKVFEKVIIINHSTQGRLRKIPDNCEIRTHTKAKSIGRKMFLLIGLLFRFKLLTKIISSERKALKIAINFRIFNLSIFLSELANSFNLFLFISKMQLDLPNIYVYWFDNKAMAAAMYRFKKPKSFCVSRAHRGDLYEEETISNYIPFNQFKSKHLSKIYFISENGFDYFKNKINDKFQNLAISKLGVEISETYPQKETQEFVIVSCSFIAPVKRIELLIEALSLIHDFEIKWIHIGDGSERLGIYDLAKNKLDKQNIEYQFIGSITNTEILDFYSKNYIDLFINVSASEGIPVSIMEAMSFSIPVIATNVGGVAELVNNENGILLDKGFSPKTLSEKIIEMINLSEADKNRLRKNSRNKIIEEFSANTNYYNYAQELFKLTL